MYCKYHRIHGTGIFTYIYHKFEPNVGKYIQIVPVGSSLWELWFKWGLAVGAHGRMYQRYPSRLPGIEPWEAAISHEPHQCLLAWVASLVVTWVGWGSGLEDLSRLVRNIWGWNVENMLPGIISWFFAIIQVPYVAPKTISRPLVVKILHPVGIFILLRWAGGVAGWFLVLWMRLLTTTGIPHLVRCYRCMLVSGTPEKMKRQFLKMIFLPRWDTLVP